MDPPSQTCAGGSSTNGTAGSNGAAGVGIETNIDQPFGVEIGPDGALYITEVGQHRVRRYANDFGPGTPHRERITGDGNILGAV